jgi:hypothetical protein
LDLAAGSIYRLADPTSTLCDTHLLVVHYDVNPRLQHDHQQVAFKSAVLWLKEKWIAKETKSRYPSGNKQDIAEFRKVLGTDYEDAEKLRHLKENTSYKIVTIALHLTISNRDGTEDTFYHPMHTQILHRRSDDSPRLFQFDNIDNLLNDTKIPRGLPAVRSHAAQLFQALYCQPEISKLPFQCSAALLPFLF